MESRRKPRAYSLVELLIAVAILTFGLATIYGQFRDTRQPSQRRLFLAQAQFHAQKLLSEALACSYDELRGWKPAPSFSTIEDETRFGARTTVGMISGDAIEVVVQVGWNARPDSQGQEFPDGQLVTVKGLHVQ